MRCRRSTRASVYDNMGDTDECRATPLAQVKSPWQPRRRTLCWQ
jgi:hypothetical protein